jgi:hypothetical protein
MKNGRLFPRLKVEALQLPDEVIQVLKNHRFRMVQDILSFGISDTALLCQMDGNAIDLIEGALDVPPICVTLLSEKTPFKKANSFEEKILYTGSAEFLESPTANLSVSVRGARILSRLHLKTITDVLGYGLANLTTFTNIGEFTLRNIENAIMDLMDGQLLNHQTGFRTLLDCLLPLSADRCNIVKARFGFDTGKGSTLREIGQQFEMSIERVRKIIMEEMRKMVLGKAGIALSLLRQRVAVVLIKNGYIAALDDIAAHPFFRNNNGRRVLFLINILSTIFPKKYRTIDDHYVTSLSPAEVVKRKISITSAYNEFRRQMAAAEVALIEAFPLSAHYVLHCLQQRHETGTLSKGFKTKTSGVRRDQEIFLGM